MTYSSAGACRLKIGAPQARNACDAGAPIAVVASRRLNSRKAASRIGALPEGGGRKPPAGTDPGRIDDLRGLFEPDARGDPQSPLLSTCKSPSKLYQSLRDMGREIGRTSVGAFSPRNRVDYHGALRRSRRQGAGDGVGRLHWPIAARPPTASSERARRSKFNRATIHLVARDRDASYTPIKRPWSPRAAAAGWMEAIMKRRTVLALMAAATAGAALTVFPTQSQALTRLAPIGPPIESRLWRPAVATPEDLTRAKIVRVQANWHWYGRGGNVHYTPRRRYWRRYK